MRRIALSLRSKLLLACLVVQFVAGVLLLVDSLRTLERTLADQAATHTRQVAALIEQTVAAPLAQRDYATLQQSLDLLRADEALAYLVLHDHRERVVAAAGWDPARALPPRDGSRPDLDRADATWHLGLPLVLAGQALGRIDLGLSTADLRNARSAYLQRSLRLGVLALAASLAVLAAIAFAATRHLARLGDASRAVAEGRFDVRLDATSGDEIGRVAESFNAMAAALEQRVAALQASEQRQRTHLDAAREVQSRLTTLLGAMDGGIVFVDADARVLYANKAFARIWARPQPMPGERLADIVPDLERQVLSADAAHVRNMHAGDDAERARLRELRTVDGRVVTQRAQPVSAGVHGRSGWIWFHEDVTLERRTQRRAQQALIDPLTRLPNRRGLYESLHAATAAATADQRPVTLMFVDLDDFKHANDVAGHRTGDAILVAVARTLTAQMRRGEIVARLGGDEFAVICPGIDAEEARSIAARLVQAVSELRFEAAGRSLRVGCSIGIATHPRDAVGADELLACADRAMYEAKQGGKNAWAAYRSDLRRSQAESTRMNWNARLQRAIEDRRFVLHFQPVRRSADLQVTHHEALLRMVDEDDPARLWSPADFIVHAERSGMIRPIDRWVFERCVEQLAQTEAPVRLAANLSMRSLEDAAFPSFLREALQRHDVDPRRLHIEVTETSATADPLAVRGMIDALRGLGCGVHLDDFGSGYNSFARLKGMDVDAVKIDGSFVRDLAGDESSRVFVASMIEIAHSMNKIAIAEHVEDAATLELLREFGVDMVQGFHLGRPAPRLVDVRVPANLRVVVGDFRRSSGYGMLS
ncbi:MAG TPA: EAL domain-containing protein [Burkholderiaceae bacterium]|nr:EAL domain-containing protein [Burkholderiaceae bacterium]